MRAPIGAGAAGGHAALSGGGPAVACLGEGQGECEGEGQEHLLELERPGGILPLQVNGLAVVCGVAH